LEAWRFGVPQLRRRLFILAARRDLGIVAESVMPAGAQHEDFHARDLIRAAEAGEPKCPPGLSVKEAIGDLPSIDAGGGEEGSTSAEEARSAYQKARRVSASLLLNHKSRTHSKAMLAKIKMIEEGGRNFELPDENRFRAQEREYFSQAYGRLHRHGIAQTI